ncbi:major facilitator superfamily transporter [Hortaea werneckii]|nr:major facilitator superfamily transporter [Hortaea werneckii]KAI7317545.1 major facilitator superfamily transporter [Hortaea werneckii]
MSSIQHDPAASGAVGVAVPKLLPESGSLNDGRQGSTGQDWDNVKLEARITGQRLSEGDIPSEVDADGEIKQDGVRRTEAITATWDRKTLVMMFMALYLAQFVELLLSAVQTNLNPYITSAFEQHGLTAVVSIVATITGGTCNLFIAKLVDIWGRVEGFFFMLFLIVLGAILKAACQNIEMYAAANTIYWVGHIGFGYVITIILTDVTTLRNRIILYGMYSTPTIATVFAGPKIAADFLNNVSWRWAFGAFIIIICAVCVPPGFIFIRSIQKCKKNGTYPARRHTRTFMETFKHYFVQFDVVGMLLTIAGWSLLLLPFSLASYAPGGWSSYYIILMIVLGVVCLAGFVIWERYFAPVPYIPWKFLKDRTILGACFMYGFMFLSIYCWDTYYYSYLQVVNDQTVTNAGYILNAFSLMSAFIAPFTGLVLRYWGCPKWLSISMTPFAVLGTALLIHFRHPGTYVGWLVMCQLFSGIYSGVWVLTGQLIITASVNHQEVAVALALFGLFGSIGASIGEAIAGAMWTNMLYNHLVAFLPAESKDLAASIYASLETQLTYKGTPTGEAINQAYGYVMKRMVICGVCFIPLCIICILVWRNVDTKNLEKERGEKTKGARF